MIISLHLSGCHARDGRSLAPTWLLGNNVKMPRKIILLRLWSLLFLLAVLGGCTAKPYKHQVSLNEALNPPVVAETGTVEGQVRITTKYGEVQTGGDSTVYLVPVTPYATEWFDHYVMQQKKIDGKDPRSFASTHAAIVDNDGHFEFQAIPAGSYYVTCNVHYPHRGLKIGRFSFSLRTVETVEAYAKTHVSEGEKAEVLVTR
jgi:hypothetical protein